jgi:type II secretion system protein G
MKKGFTLIELLIVVAIIAILAAIAVPNFLEAQTRSKVARVKSDMRSMATALEAYYTDNNRYPYCNNRGTALGSGLDTYTNGHYLDALSTPVAYITSVSFKDPFIYKGRYSAATAAGIRALTAPTALTGSDVAAQLNLLIYQSWNSDQRPVFPPDSFTDLTKDTTPRAWVLHSTGPDGCYYNLGGVLSNDGVDKVGDTIDLIYDPTNGTVSRGSVFRAGGQSYGVVSSSTSYKAGSGLRAAIDLQR